MSDFPKEKYLKATLGASLMVQWLRLQAPNAGEAGLIPGWRTKIPHGAQWGLKEKKKAVL